MEDLTGLGKLADSRVVNKAYDDALSDPMKETGKLLTDATKAFRLFLAPFQLLAVAQDRLAAFCERVRKQVPDERQQEAPPSIAIPVLLSLRYMEDENPLTELFLNLLARAIDKERCGEAHPAFVRIIEQLSPDEAVILAVLSERRIEIDAGMRRHATTISRAFMGVEGVDFPLEKLVCPEHFWMYIDHLESLQLLTAEPYKDDAGDWHAHEIWPSSFGQLFIKACVPCERNDGLGEGREA